jgi:hypothetical protein
MGPIVLALPEGASGEQLRSLRDWLGHQGDLRGRIGDIEGKPGAEALGGGLMKALSVAVGSGGAITILVSGVISWLRQVAGQRRAAALPGSAPVPTEVTMEFADGSSIKISTAVAQAWTAAELSVQIDTLARAVTARALAPGETSQTS